MFKNRKTSEDDLFFIVAILLYGKSVGLSNRDCSFLQIPQILNYLTVYTQTYEHVIHSVPAEKCVTQVSMFFMSLVQLYKICVWFNPELDSRVRVHYAWTTPYHWKGLKSTSDFMSTFEVSFINGVWGILWTWTCTESVNLQLELLMSTGTSVKLAISPKWTITLSSWVAYPAVLQNSTWRYCHGVTQITLPLGNVKKQEEKW